MGMTIDKCRTCKHAFTTCKDRLYCKKSLADKDDCGEYEMIIEEVNVRLYDIKTDAIYQITSEEKEAIDIAIDTMRKYQKIEQIINNTKDLDGAIRFNWLYEQIKEVIEDGKID